MVAVLLGVLAVMGVAVALADSAPPAPSITSALPANPTNSTSASFTYTDSASVTKFQCQLDGGGFVDCGTVRPSTKSFAGPLAQGSHTFDVRAVSGSKTSSATSYTWVVDTTAPSVTSANTANPSPTAAASVSWTVKFSEDVVSLTASNFALVAGGGVAGAGGITVSGSAPTSIWTVTANTGTGSGTLQLKLANGTAVKDKANNPLGPPIPFNGGTYTIDKTPPVVSSITRIGASPTAGSSVQWQVVFSEAVTGVDTGDFALANTGLSSPSLSSVSGSGTTYTVTASTGSGSGTLGLNLVDNDTVVDGVGNKLGGSGTGNGNATGPLFSVDRTPPVVQSINRAGSSPTNAGSVQWTVTFSKSVSGVDSTDFSLIKTGLGGTPAVTAVSAGPSTTYTVTASTGSGSGTLGLNLVDNDSVVDGLGNKLGGTGNGNGNFSGQVYTVDRTAPTVVSADQADPSPTNAGTVHWTVVFSEPVTGVAPGGSNFSLVASGLTGSPAITGVTGSGTTYTVTATTGTGTSGPSGTLQLKVTTAGAIVDAAGNPLAGLPFSGQTYTIDKTAPDAPNLTFAPFPWPPLGWSSTSAIFSFNDSSSDVVSYLCKLDAGGFVACSSPTGYSALSQGKHTFKVKAVDGAGNISGETSWTFFVDTIAPTKPVFSQTPPDPSPTATSTFAWNNSSDPGYPTTGTGVAGYLCSKENGSYFSCSSPYSYTVQTTNNGEHQFAVVAVDWAGNISQANTYKWKVGTSTGAPYTICPASSPCAVGPLSPGAAASPINVTFSSPNSGNGGSGVNGTQVSNLAMAITSITGASPGPNPCTAADYVITQFSGTYPFYVPFGPSSLSSIGFVTPSQWPSIRMLNRADSVPGNGSGNQNACKGAVVHLSFQGTP